MMCPGSIPGAALGPVSFPPCWPGRFFRTKAKPRRQPGLLRLESQMTIVEPRARISDPETSHEAAANAGRDAERVKAAVRWLLNTAGRDGLTDEELNNAYKVVRASHQWPVVDIDTPRRRRSELLGEVVKAGRRKNSKGSNVTVWALAKFGGMA